MDISEACPDSDNRHPWESPVMQACCGCSAQGPDAQYVDVGRAICTASARRGGRRPVIAVDPEFRKTTSDWPMGSQAPPHRAVRRGSGTASWPWTFSSTSATTPRCWPVPHWSSRGRPADHGAGVSVLARSRRPFEARAAVRPAGWRPAADSQSGPSSFLRVLSLFASGCWTRRSGVAGGARGAGQRCPRRTRRRGIAPFSRPADFSVGRGRRLGVPPGCRCTLQETVCLVVPAITAGPARLSQFAAASRRRLLFVDDGSTDGPPTSIGEAPGSVSATGAQPRQSGGGAGGITRAAGPTPTDRVLGRQNSDAAHEVQILRFQLVSRAGRRRVQQQDLPPGADRALVPAPPLRQASPQRGSRSGWELPGAGPNCSRGIVRALQQAFVSRGSRPESCCGSARRTSSSTRCGSGRTSGSKLHPVPGGGSGSRRIRRICR
jgi:hypothetical protein